MFNRWPYLVNYTRKLEFIIRFNIVLKFQVILTQLETIDGKALVKLRVSNHKLMIETGRYNQTLLNVMTRVKFRRICMESSKHNWANISETICPTMLVFGK